MPKHAPKRVEKPWGHEIIWATSGRYAGKTLHVKRGCRLSRQYHRLKEETLYVNAGAIELEVVEGELRETVVLRAGEAYHLPPGAIHRLTALEDSDVLEASSPELDDVVRLEDDYGRT